MLKIKWNEKNWKFKTGIILILISLVFFTLLIIIPFTNISRQDKITLTSITFILAEVLFYSGGFLLGKEIFNKYKLLLNPVNWFKKKETVKVSIEEEFDDVKNI